MITCKKCGMGFQGKAQKFIEEHHIKPRCCGGTDKDGRIQLCKDCHVELHKIIYWPMKNGDFEKIQELTEVWLNDS